MVFSKKISDDLYLWYFDKNKYAKLFSCIISLLSESNNKNKNYEYLVSEQIRILENAITTDLINNSENRKNALK